MANEITPATRWEKLLSEVLGEEYAVIPVTRIEKFLANILGEEYDLIPVTRIEKLLAKIAKEGGGGGGSALLSDRAYIGVIANYGENFIDLTYSGNNISLKFLREGGNNIYHFNLTARTMTATRADLLNNQPVWKVLEPGHYVFTISNVVNSGIEFVFNLRKNNTNLFTTPEQGLFTDGASIEFDLTEETDLTAFYIITRTVSIAQGSTLSFDATLTKDGTKIF